MITGRRLAISFLWGLCGVLLSGWNVAGGAQTPPATAVSVELGVEVAARGQELRLPVILSSFEKHVRSVTLRVKFPAKQLEFQRPEAPAQSQTEKATAASVSDDAAGGNKTIEVRITSKQGMWLKDGIIALLNFKVTDAAEPGDVTVANSPRVTLENGEERTAEQAKDGTVTILEVPPTVIACMFYMH